MVLPVFVLLVTLVTASPGSQLLLFSLLLGHLPDHRSSSMELWLVDFGLRTSLPASPTPESTARSSTSLSLTSKLEEESQAACAVCQPEFCFFPGEGPLST